MKCEEADKNEKLPVSWCELYRRVVGSPEKPTGIFFHKHGRFRVAVFGSVHLSILVPSVAGR